MSLLRQSLLCCLLIAHGSTLCAQDDVAPDIAPQRPPELFQPAVIGYVQSLNQLDDDLNYLQKLGLPKAAIVHALETNFDFGLATPLKMKGVDRDLPIGFYTNFQTNEAGSIDYQVVAFIPVTDIDAFFESIKLQYGEPESVGDGYYKIGVLQRFYVRQTAGWLFASFSKDELEFAPKDLTAAITRMKMPQDICVQMDIEQLPENQRSELFKLFPMDIFAGGNAGEQFGLGDDFQPPSIDAKYLKVGLLIDQQARKSSIDCELVAVEGSPLAKLFEDSKLETEFGGFMTSDAAFKIQFGVTIPDLNHFAPIVELANHLRETEPANDVEWLQLDLLELLLLTIEARKLDGGFGLFADREKGSVNLVAGVGIADGELLDDVLKRFIKLSKTEGWLTGFEQIVERIQWDFDKQDDVTFHRTTIKSTEMPFGQMVESLFGKEIQLVIGIGKKAVYVAFGSDPLPHIKTVIRQSATFEPEQSPLLQSELHLAALANSPAGRLAASIAESPFGGDRFGDVDAFTDKRGLIKKLNEVEGGDAIYFAALSDENRFKLHLSAEDGILEYFVKLNKDLLGIDTNHNAQVRPAIRLDLPYRTWTSSGGHYTVEARLILTNGASAKLQKRDGTILDVKLGSLTQQDRDYVRQTK